MKTLLTLAIILTTIAAQAQVININTGQHYPSIPSQYNGWSGYETRTWAHHADGFRPVAEVPNCAEGYQVANADWSEVGGVVVFTWDCEPMPPPPVPTVVTKFRFWLAFHGATGLSNRDVESVILAWEDSAEKAQALIALDSARDYRRSNPFVDVLRVEAGLTEEQMDAVFIAASQLEVD